MSFISSFLKNQIDSFCSDDEVNSEEEFDKSGGGCEIEEVEEECLEECGGEDNGAETKENTEQSKGNPIKKSFLLNKERKIILEFGKPGSKPDKQDILTSNNGLQSESKSSIVSLESFSTVRAKPLTVTSKKVEKTIISAENIAELVEKAPVQKHSVPSTPSVKNESKDVVDSELKNSDKKKDKPQDQMDSAVSALKAALVVDSQHEPQAIKERRTAHDQRKQKTETTVDSRIKPKSENVLMESGQVFTTGDGGGGGGNSKSGHSRKVNLDGSLTERTLKVVTEKVRQMNSK